MICQEIPIEAPGYEEKATLTTYFLSYSEEMPASEIRPLVLICPGGGYSWTSAREGEPLAARFMAMGFHAAVLWYSVSPSRYPVALLQLANAVRYLREHAGRYHIDPEGIIVQGCSAGGHLAASLGVFWNRPFLAEACQTDSLTLRPDALLLCYPVITSGPFAHQDSFRQLLGDRYDDLVSEMSLENQVSADTPKTFLWHTATDGTVPVENSLMFFSALHGCGVSAEMHIYQEGRHGLSLCIPDTAGISGTEIQKECENWIDLAKNWLYQNFN